MKMFCENCRESHEHEKPPTYHFLHFIVTVFFFPWVILWVASYYFSGYECSKCGTVRK